MKKALIFVFLVLSNLINSQDQVYITKKSNIKCMRTKNSNKICWCEENSQHATWINPCVIEETELESPLIVDSPIVILDSTDIKRKVVLPKNLIAITTFPSELQFHIFDFIDASSVSLENLIKSFFQMNPGADTLFIIKKAICSNVAMPIDNMYIELRTSEQCSKVLFESESQSNRCCKFLWHPESCSLRLQTISCETKEKEQKKLLKEFLGTRKTKVK